MELLRFNEAGVEVVVKASSNIYSILLTYLMMAFLRISDDQTLCDSDFIMLQDAKKRWERQSRAFYNLFRQPDRVEKLAEIVERLVSTTSIYSILWLIGVFYILLNACHWSQSVSFLQEQGELKLRVRTLESERAFQRVAAVQKTVGYVSSELLMNRLTFCCVPYG
jgi:hypothetical protein